VTGEAGCALGLEVTLGVLALLDHDDVPVACDPNRPDDAGDWPFEFLTGIDSLTTGLPAVVGASGEERPAHQLIAEVVAESDQPVTLVAVAPLTNVARALERHPEFVDQVDQIVIMGGAVDARGNVEGFAAEWNLWIDVPSAAQVFASGAPITLVPLDATNDVPVPAFWQRDLELAEQTAAIVYLAGLVDIFPDVTSGFFYLWDELAASVAAGDDAVALRQMQLVVLEKAGPEYGKSARASGGAQMSVAVGATDPQRFYEQFLATLAGAPVDRSSLLVDVELPPTTVTPSSTPVEVLAYWLHHALRGDVDEAASVVAPGAVWVGLGNSPDSFVNGSAPYEASDIDLVCTATQAVAWCDVQWTDIWVAAIPDLGHGSLQVQAEVVDGLIVAFREFSFGGNVAAAFGSHIAWLESDQPERFAQACSPDPASKDCTELLVSTVHAWVARR
jgi:pyrimidine-specific ribonucleoside hydrolase